MYYIWSDKERGILQVTGAKDKERAISLLTSDEHFKDEIEASNIETLERWEEVKTFIRETEPTVLEDGDALLEWVSTNGTRLV